MPFIRPGVALYGINSVFVPNVGHTAAWSLMAQHLNIARLEAMSTEIGLTEAIAYAPALIEGRVGGRSIVDTAR